MNLPFASLYATIFLARVLFTPDTYSSKAADAVLRSTPTMFTLSSTTPPKDSSSFF